MFNKKEYMKKYKRKWYLKNKKKVYEYNKKYIAEHPEWWKIHHKTDKKYIREYMRKHRKKLRRIYRQNINHKLIEYLRSRIYNVLKGNTKSDTTIKLIGCSIDKLKKHLEYKFKSGMSWSNYGKWHIDHIRPCCSFDLSKPSEQRKCFHYTNLQPLWAKENWEKNKKIL